METSRKSLYLSIRSKLGSVKRWLYYRIRHRSEINEVFKLLEDDASRDALEAFIRFKINKSPNALLKVTRHISEQYFDHQLISFGKHETFVDMGVLDGATSFRFIDEVAGDYDKVLMFEPDVICYEKTKKAISEKADKNVLLFNEGCYDRDEKLFFSGNAVGSSKVTSEMNANAEINVVSLDSKLRSMQDIKHITYIKMDIEGSEYKALVGSAETIKRFSPRLAVSIYHKSQDIWEIPLLIKKIAPQYKFYIRHYYDVDTALKPEGGVRTERI